MRKIQVQTRRARCLSPPGEEKERKKASKQASKQAPLIDSPFSFSSRPCSIGMNSMKHAHNIIKEGLDGAVHFAKVPWW